MLYEISDVALNSWYSREYDSGPDPDRWPDPYGRDDENDEEEEE